MNLIRITARREAGFSLVELMVGMVIGLIAIVVMFQIFSVSEGQRRSTTGAGDAQQNGVTSLYLMERDARMAGYGFNFTPMLGCTTNGFYATTGANFTFKLVPVQIVDGGAKGPDQVTFTYGQSAAFSLPGVLALPTASTPNYYKIEDSRFQFNPGDLVVAANVQAGVMPNCWITQVTGLPDPPYSDRVQWGQTSYVDGAGTTHVAEYSPPFALPVAYTKWNKTLSTGGRLLNLGQGASSTTYSVVNNQLVANDAFLPGTPMVISDGIVQMQVQYGYSWDCPPALSTATAYLPCRIDSTATTTGIINTAANINQWGDVMPAAAVQNDWRKIIAVRMAIVARSTEAQSKADIPPPGVYPANCTATTAQPIWQATGTTLWVDANPDWKCYRYKVFELVVPIRNLMWYADPTGSTVPPAATP